jgi:alpha-mannosidase
VSNHKWTALLDGGICSLFGVVASNIVIETVKPAEDGSTDVIVRLHETKHAATRCVLRTVLPVRSVHPINMLEDASRARLPFRNGQVALQFHPFEIKTLRLTMV